MIYEKMISSKTSLDAIPSAVSANLVSTSSVYTYVAPLDFSGLTGRYNFYLRGPYHTEQVAYEPRVSLVEFSSTGTGAGATNYVTCNYLSGDFFYRTSSHLSGKVYLQVSNMSGTAHQGRNVILKVNLGNPCSAYFADYGTKVMLINTGTDYASGTYYFVFANIDGSNVELVNFFKGYPDVKDSTGIKDNVQ